MADLIVADYVTANAHGAILDLEFRIAQPSGPPRVVAHIQIRAHPTRMRRIGKYVQQMAFIAAYRAAR